MNHVYASVSQFVIPFFRNLLIFGQSLISGLTISWCTCIYTDVNFTLISLRANVKLKSESATRQVACSQALAGCGRAKERGRARETRGRTKTLPPFLALVLPRPQLPRARNRLRVKWFIPPEFMTPIPASVAKLSADEELNGMLLHRWVNPEQ